MRTLGLLISCRDASRAISQMQDGSVPMPLHARVRFHLLWCEACRRFLAQLRFLHAAMRRYRM
ncbi:MAG TPA: zf-HC2 domain-containing protein [Casimicrobiaceae bacterium]|nr:zf-HC2 domain-containing protein [Casimicrobiaceae bacterium]